MKFCVRLDIWQPLVAYWMSRSRSHRFWCVFLSAVLSLEQGFYWLDLNTPLVSMSLILQSSHFLSHFFPVLSSISPASLSISSLISLIFHIFHSEVTFCTGALQYRFFYAQRINFTYLDFVLSVCIFWPLMVLLSAYYCVIVFSDMCRGWLLVCGTWVIWASALCCYISKYLVFKNWLSDFCFVFVWLTLFAIKDINSM